MFICRHLSSSELNFNEHHLEVQILSRKRMACIDLHTTIGDSYYRNRHVIHAESGRIEMLPDVYLSFVLHVSSRSKPDALRQGARPTLAALSTQHVRDSSRIEIVSPSRRRAASNDRPSTPSHIAGPTLRQSTYRTFRIPAPRCTKPARAAHCVSGLELPADVTISYS